MTRFAVLAAVVWLAACSTPSAPEGDQAVFTFDVPAEVEDAPHLRYALVWLEGTRARVVGGGRARGSEMSVRVSWPAQVDAKKLTPVESMLVAQSVPATDRAGVFTGPNAVRAPVYRPRVVLYRDFDGDRELTLSESSPDRIVATDYYLGVAALLDPEAVVERLTLEQAREFYAGGREFSRFLPASDHGGELYVLNQSPIVLYSGPHAERREDVLCGRAYSSQRATTETRVVIDDSLEPEVTCPTGIVDCKSASLADMKPPTYETTPDVQRFAQCRRSSALAALSVYSASPSCRACVCSDEPVVAVYLAPRDDLPSWWPCGDEIQYCDDGFELTSTAICGGLFGSQAPLPSRTDAGVSPSVRDAGVSPAGRDAGP